MCQFGDWLRRQLIINSNNFVIFDKNKLIGLVEITLVFSQSHLGGHILPKGKCLFYVCKCCKRA